MEEELLFGYPYPDEIRMETENNFTVIPSSKRAVVIALICLMISGAALILFAIKMSVYTLLISIAAIYTALYIIRNKTSSEHLLEISAYETYMELQYFDCFSDRISYYRLPYKSIVSCKIDDGKYNSVKLILNYNHPGFEQKTRDISSRKDVSSPLKSTLFFRLNEGSPEQEFFLYIAKELFTVSNPRGKIIKHMGTREYFRQKYYSEMQEEIDNG